MNASTKPTAALLSVFFLWLATSFSGTAQEASGTRPEADPSAALFGGPGLVFELQVSEEGIASLRRKPRENVAADLTVGADKWVVAVRIKGSAGSVKPVDDRPALSIDCDKLVEGQRIFGLKRFYLNNSAQDLARMHECLAYEFHTRLGIPVARVTHALVKLNGRELGVYVLKEGYDKTFLGRHFAKKSGNLYDAPLGKDVTDDLELDSGKEPADYADLKALRAAIAEPDLARRLAMFERCLELEHFIAMTALQAFTADWDGYCYGANNYRIYVPPETGRAVFIPCGMDQLFQRDPWPLDTPFKGGVAKALFAIPSQQKRLRETMLRVQREIFTPARLSESFAPHQARLKQLLEKVSEEEAKRVINFATSVRDRTLARSVTTAHLLGLEAPVVKKP
ncbi:MAG: CotH kinase family protein [Verrucomicrobiota bacterium]|nr:CotH kinase family protein [Verrucomicrobiota bacterium]